MLRYLVGIYDPKYLEFTQYTILSMDNICHFQNFVNGIATINSTCRTNCVIVDRGMWKKLYWPHWWETSYSKLLFPFILIWMKISKIALFCHYRILIWYSDPFMGTLKLKRTGRWYIYICRRVLLIFTHNLYYPYDPHPLTPMTPSTSINGSMQNCGISSALAMELQTLKTKGPQFEKFVITGGTVSCHYDNLRCRQWRQSCQINDLLFSVKCTGDTQSYTSHWYGHR